VIPVGNLISRKLLARTHAVYQYTSQYLNINNKPKKKIRSNMIGFHVGLLLTRDDRDERRIYMKSSLNGRSRSLLCV